MANRQYYAGNFTCNKKKKESCSIDSFNWVEEDLHLPAVTPYTFKHNETEVNHSTLHHI